MKILITGGGTDVPIDSVRSITNKSGGFAAASLARHFLENGDEVTYFCSKKALTPFNYDVKNVKFETLDEDDLDDYHDKCSSANTLYRWVDGRYEEKIFSSFYEYRDGIRELVSDGNFDMIILVAAVSDYVCEQSAGKERTKSNMTIELVECEKIISSIRDLESKRSLLVGFKLLVGSSDEELVEVARKACVKNDCDIVLANDLNNIKKGIRKYDVVGKNGKLQTLFDSEEPIMKQIMKGLEKHYEM